MGRLLDYNLVFAKACMLNSRGSFYTKVWVFLLNTKIVGTMHGTNTGWLSTCFLCIHSLKQLVTAPLCTNVDGLSPCNVPIFCNPFLMSCDFWNDLVHKEWNYCFVIVVISMNSIDYNNLISIFDDFRVDTARYVECNPKYPLSSLINSFTVPIYL